MQIISDSIKGKYGQLFSQGLLVLVLGITVVSYVISLNAFISPTRELRWDGTISYISNTVYNPGDPVLVEGRLIEGDSYFSLGYYYFFAPEDIRWIIVVIDPNNMPIYMETSVVTNANGVIDTGQINFNLPSSADPGIYHIRMIVWSDLLPTGETRTRQIQEITFEVI